VFSTCEDLHLAYSTTNSKYCELKSHLIINPVENWENGTNKHHFKQVKMVNKYWKGALLFMVTVLGILLNNLVFNPQSHLQSPCPVFVEFLLGHQHCSQDAGKHSREA
jgi:hypothetical protein